MALCIFIFFFVSFSVTHLKYMFVGKHWRKHYKFLPQRAELGLIFLKSSLKVTYCRCLESFEHCILKEISSE